MHKKIHSDNNGTATKSGMDFYADYQPLLHKINLYKRNC